jgi:hypothetical protein
VPESVSSLKLSLELVNVGEDCRSPAHLILPSVVLDREIFKLIELLHLIVQLDEHIRHA